MKKIENKADIEGRDVRICVGLRARRANQEEEARSRIWKRPRARLATTTAEKNALGIEIVIADEKRRVGGMEEEMPVNGNHWQPEERPSIDPSFIEARSTPISLPPVLPFAPPCEFAFTKFDFTAGIYSFLRLRLLDFQTIRRTSR